MAKNLWASDEVVTGAPVAADADPNVTPPTRTLNAPRNAGSGPASLALFCQGGGTSIVTTVYVQDPSIAGTANWIQWGAALTLLPGVAQFINVPGQAKIFLRNAAPTGSITARAAGFQ